jgi:hypothetical protein
VHGAPRAEMVAAPTPTSCRPSPTDDLCCIGDAPPRGIDPRDVRILQVSAGTLEKCALRSTGRVFRWGGNNLGQLGDETIRDRATPGPMHGLDDAFTISTGDGTACAHHVGGRVACGGDGALGRARDLGDIGGPWTELSKTPLSVNERPEHSRALRYRPLGRGIA